LHIHLRERLAGVSLFSRGPLRNQASPPSPASRLRSPWAAGNFRGRSRPRSKTEGSNANKNPLHGPVSERPTEMGPVIRIIQMLCQPVNIANSL
jgi:hypothetical protein